MSREALSEIAQQHTMDYVTKMGEDQKQELRDVLSEGLAEGKGMREIAKDMEDKVEGMKDTRARSIARTETTRTKNLGSWYKYKEKDFQSFTVDFTGEACDLCVERFENIVFPIDAVEMLPPEGTHPHCYDNETEVYTDSGWKLFKDVSENDLILSINPESHRIEFTQFMEKIERHYTGDMIHFKNRWFDMMVTPEHKMYVKTAKNWYFQEARDVKKSSSILRTAEWDVISTKKITVGGIEFSPEDYAFFIGWYLSEGSVIPKGDPHGARITISQQKSDNLENIYKKISAIFEGHATVHKREERVVFHHEGLRDYLLQFGKQPDRYIPGNIKELSKYHINIFLEAYYKGDGHERINSNKLVSNSREIVFHSSSKRIAEDISELILKAGGYPSFSIQKNKGKKQEFNNGTYTLKTDIYTVRWNRSKTANVHSMDVRRIPYDDMVYCLQLEKNHILWVKRNNKTAFSGNCMCVAVFHQETPEEYAEKYGYEVYDGGGGEEVEVEEDVVPEDFNISEDELLDEILPTLSQDDISFTKHATERIDERPLDIEWVYTNLMNKTPVLTEKQESDLFKMYYEHPDKEYKDMIIVVSVKKNKKSLNIVTTYEQDVDKRI